MRPEPCDLLIEPRWLLPVAPENTVLTNTGLVVRDGRIIALGPVAELREGALDLGATKEKAK